MKSKVIFSTILGIIAAVVIGVIFNDLFSMLSAGSGVTLATSLAAWTNTCGKRSSGCKQIWLAEAPDVTSFTLGSQVQSYATVTMVSGKLFYKYEFEQDTCEFKESSKVENGVLMITQSVEFHLDKMSQLERDAVANIQTASACGMIAIVEDNNGAKWVVGYDQEQLKVRPLQLKSAEATTGKKMSDVSGETVTLGRDTTEKARTFTGTVPIT